MPQGILFLVIVKQQTTHSRSERIFIGQGEEMPEFKDVYSIIVVFTHTNLLPSAGIKLPFHIY